jgi:hypothetical protein
VRYSRPLDDVTWEDGSPVTTAYYGHCARCPAGHGNSITGGYQTREQAIAAWNRRDESHTRADVEMDVDDLARALCRRIGASHPLHQWEEIAVAYELAIMAFPHLRPALESHTRAAVDAAEARIVAWLRGEIKTAYTDPQYDIGINLADAIERGEHRRQP